MRRRERGWSGIYRDHLGTAHHYDSRWELRRMQFLDLSGYRFVREGVRIPYRFEGRPRTYIVDLVVFDDLRGLTWIEEIKPKRRNDDPQNVAKWAAARAWCAAAGYEFVVVNEADLLRPPAFLAAPPPA